MTTILLGMFLAAMGMFLAAIAIEMLGERRAAAKPLDSRAQPGNHDDERGET